LKTTPPWTLSAASSAARSTVDVSATWTPPPDRDATLSSIAPPAATTTHASRSPATPPP